jgi:hypothetical protein
MFNEFETAIFAWFKQNYPKANLGPKLDSAKLTERQWTKVGFFVYFEVDRSLPWINLEKREGVFLLDGPYIKSDDVDLGGSSILWGRDGYLNCLEIYAFGEYCYEEIKSFEFYDGYFSSGEFITIPRKP